MTVHPSTARTTRSQESTNCPKMTFWVYLSWMYVKKQLLFMTYFLWAFFLQHTFTLDSITLLNIQVYCDMETNGGGWTVIQRRKIGLTSFSRDWKQYKSGFGSIRGDFWLGNDNIFRLTRQPSVLRIDIEVRVGKHTTTAQRVGIHSQTLNNMTKSNMA